MHHNVHCPLTIYQRPLVTIWQRFMVDALGWRYNECDGASNHGCLDCLRNHLFRRWTKKTPKLRVTGFWERNSPVTGEFPTHLMTSSCFLETLIFPVAPKAVWRISVAHIHSWIFTVCTLSSHTKLVFMPTNIRPVIIENIVQFSDH